MKKFFCILSAFLIFALAGCASAEVAGNEIKGLQQMNDTDIVQVLTSSGDNSMMVYDVEGEDVIKLRDTLIENTYIREKNAEISDELEEKAYVIIYEQESGEKLRITVYAGEYIQVDDQFNNDYLKINKPDFEKQFKEALWIE